MPAPRYSDDEIEATLLAEGARIPDDFVLVDAGYGLTVVQFIGGKPHVQFMDDEWATCLTSFLKRAGTRRVNNIAELTA